MIEQRLLKIVVVSVFLLAASMVTALVPGEQPKSDPQNHVGVPPCDDADIERSSPDHNFGASKRLALRNGSDINFDVRTLLQFNLSRIPMGTQIHYAHLFLYFYFYNPDYGNPAGRPYPIYRLTESWNEETVCWNNQSDKTAVASDVAYCPNGTGQWIDWNVTSDVQAFINGTLDNHGWIIIDETNGTGELPYAIFLSKEDKIFKYPRLLIDVDVNYPPLPASDPYPGDGQGELPGNTDISWVGNDPNVGENLTFDVYFGTTNPPPLISTNQSATTVDLPRLRSNCDYYWRIDTWDSHGEFAQGYQWHFITRWNSPPSIPQNPSPSLGAVDVNLTPTLSWSPCSDWDGDPVFYDVYFGTTNPPPLVTIHLNATTYYPGTLNCATEYYWRIVSRDNYSGATTGFLWSFTTLVNHFPHAPVITGPTSGHNNTVYNYTIVATDPENQDLSYQVDWGDGIVDPWYGPVPCNTTILRSHTWKSQGTFTIKARAMDTAGAISDWGYLTITMPYVPLTFLQWLHHLLERFPHLFPLLRYLLGR
jgi:hypothetical protein